MKDKRGLYGKFQVRRADGSSDVGGKHERCPLFVLDPVHDEHARPALARYAIEVASEYPELAKDLWEMLRNLDGRLLEPMMEETRTEAVPPLSASEAVIAFAAWISHNPKPPKAGGQLMAAATEFLTHQNFAFPRPGWEQLVSPFEGPAR